MKALSVLMPFIPGLLTARGVIISQEESGARKQG